MNDTKLANELQATTLREREAREYLASTTDVAERDSALVVLRHLTAVRKAIERWIALRACRAQLQS